MQYFDTRIYAKSTWINFFKEKSWRKNNTVRDIQLDEIDKFNFFKRDFTNKFIVIINSETGENFERKITDITKFKVFENLEGNNVYTYIISFEN